MIEDLNIFISKRFVLGVTFLGEVRQSISRNIRLSLVIIDSQVVLWEFLGPADLTRTQAFGINESTEIIIVS